MTPLDIGFYCAGMPFNGQTVYQGSLGGSETACWAMARELAKLGHKVKVFTLGESGVFEGVTYANVGPATQQAPLGAQFHFFAEQNPLDVLVIQRHPGAYSRLYNAKVQWLWLHDIALKMHAGMVAGMAWQIDRVLAVSDYHRRQVIQDYGLRPEMVTATRNALTLEWFKDAQGKREPHTLLYTSRPERGLEHLLREGGIMDRLQKAAPGRFRLSICHYADPPQAGGMEGYYRQLYSLASQRGDTTLLGHLPKGDLYKLMGRAWLHVYPTEFPEVSCITAMETQAAGLPMLTTNRTALPETLTGAGAVVLDLKRGEGGRVEVDEEAFAAEILALAEDELQATSPELSRMAGLRRQCARKAETLDWSGVAAEWEAMMLEDLRPCHGLTALAKHYLRTSDITALYHLADSHPEAITPGIRSTMESRYEPWALPASRGGSMEAYRAKYDDYYGREYGQPWAPRIMSGTQGRAMVVAEMLAPLPKGSRVLDIGPAEGSFTISLAKALPHLIFESVEMAEANRKVMAAGLEERGMTQQVRLHAGDHENLPKAAAGCSAVLCAEVLEHLPDPQGFLVKILARVGGTPLVVLTTPYGPWEALLKPEQEYGRVHLHHYERADLREMFASMEDLQLIYSPHAVTPSGEQIGHMVTAFRATGRPGAIDYERKHSRQRVPGTLSVCMIARDAGHALGRALKSIQHVADQTIVCVDRLSTDDTGEVAKRWGAEVRAVDSPMDIGFDGARNASLEGAWGNWVLWLDADEELMEPQAMLKYLRSRHGDGFGLPQYHYASDFMDHTGSMKVDYPARVFKNGRGVRFFGRVHEHPETALNDGPGRITIVGDVKIGHLAYVTEAVRQERFRRNLPLMRRDRQDYPDRLLGKFLWLRDCAYLAQEAAQRGEWEDMKAALEDAEAMWEAVVQHGNIQLLADALHFRSVANEIQRRGWWTGLDLHGIRPEGPPPEPGPETLGLRWRPKDLDELMRVVRVFMLDRAKVLEPEDLELGGGLTPSQRATFEPTPDAPALALVPGGGGAGLDAAR